MGHVPLCPLLAVVIGPRGHVRRGPFFASRDWFTGGTWPAGPAFSALCSSVRLREVRRTSTLGCGSAGFTGSSGSAGALGHRCRPWGWRLGWHRRPGLEAVPTSAVPRAGGVEAADEMARRGPSMPGRPVPVTPLHSVFRPISTWSLAAAPGAIWGPEGGRRPRQSRAPLWSTEQLCASGRQNGRLLPEAGN